VSPAAVNRILAEIRGAAPAISGLQVGDGGQVVGRHYGANISTAFQPWWTPAGEHVVAVEAYARSDSKHGERLSPWRLFADVAVDDDLINLDRLCRTVHARTLMRAQPIPIRVFTGRATTPPRFFATRVTP